MAHVSDQMFCGCSRDKAVASFCKRHLQALCVECMLSSHKDCIADIITIEEATRNTHSLWSELLTKCENYKLVYERQKCKKDGIYKKMDAINQELRVTISQMRIEMLKRINLVCKNALELSVSVMSQRMAVAKADVENLEKAMATINNIQAAAAKKHETDNDFVSDLEEARKELDTIDKLFEDIKQNRNEVLIQFVVPSIVTDFMEQFQSLGEIVEEVTAEGRTSVYSSPKERVDIQHREPMRVSQNPFKVIKTSIDNPLLSANKSDKESDLFIFHKGIYNQDERQYDYIGIRNGSDSMKNGESSSNSNARIPPLPCRKISCPSRPLFPNEGNRPADRNRKISCPTRPSSLRNSATSDFDSRNRKEQDDDELPEEDVKANDFPSPPTPAPRISLDKTIKPDILITTHVQEDNQTNQPDTANLIQQLKRNLVKTYSSHSTSSNESNTTHSSREGKTDSGIVVHIEDQPKYSSSSSINASPCITPILKRKGVRYLSHESVSRKSDTEIRCTRAKHGVPSQAVLKEATSLGHFRFPSADNRMPGNNYQNTDDHSDSEIDATKTMEALDNVIGYCSSEDNDDLGSVDDDIQINQTLAAQMPVQALSAVELWKHKKDIKDICIITSIVVTESQLIIVCDYSHNCMQLYDRLGNRIQIYSIVKPFGSCLLSEDKIAVTSRNRSSVNICVFNVSKGILTFEREHRLGNLVDAFGMSYSNGYICVCCLTHVILFTEDLRPYRTVKAFAGIKSKGTLGRKKSAKPVFSGVKYCAMDFTGDHMDIFVTDYKQDRVVCINTDGDVRWIQPVKDPKSVTLHQGKLYVAAKKQITVFEASKGLILREVHEGVPKHPWALFVDDGTSSLFITNGSVNDQESRQIKSVSLKILMTILG